jgi:hypothetical protein
MSRRNTNATDNDWSNLVWVQGIGLLTLSFLFGGVIVLSLASYVQTEMAFSSMNDPTTTLFGWKIGNLLSHAMAMLFQYGQNGALLYRVFRKGERVLFKWSRGRKKFTDKDAALILFGIFALVDAGTNVLWLYDRRASASLESSESIDKTRNLIAGFFGYGAMVLVVFVEEALGIVLELWNNTFGKFQDALHERSKQKAKEDAIGNGKYVTPKPQRPRDLKPKPANSDGRGGRYYGGGDGNTREKPKPYPEHHSLRDFIE